MKKIKFALLLAIVISTSQTGHADMTVIGGAGAAGGPPVATAASLPTSGNVDGDIRVTLDDQSVYVWKESTQSWIQSSSPAATNGITALNADVTANGPGVVSATIQPNVVTNAKLAAMPAHTIKGNNTGAAADATDMTVSQVRTELSIDNVDNTSDANKPISTAVSTALSGKEPTVTGTSSSDYYRGDKTFQNFDSAAQSASISQSITNGITTKAPSEDAVFDALSLKEPTISATSSADYYRGDKTFQPFAAAAQSAVVTQTITNGVTSTAPSEDAVFDGLATKEPTVTATTSADYYRGDKTFQPFATAAQTAVVTQSITNGVTATAPSEDAVFDALALKESTANKNANNGYAGLDAGGKLSVSQLPNTVMLFKGQWDASTNTPALADGVGTSGYVYRANVAGTTNFGSGPITFSVGDWAVYNGTIWEFAANSNLVTSVNGQQGVVSLTTTNIPEGTALYFTDARAIAAPLTGFTSGAGVLSAADTVLQAIQKLDGNISAASTGTSNKFAGFDSSGDLNPINTWAQNAFGGVDEYNTYTIASSAGNVKINNFESESDPTSAITGTNIYGSSFDMHVGKLTSGFGTDGLITALNSNLQIANDGTYGNLYNLKLNGSYGDGVSGSSISAYGFDSFDQINTGFTVSDYRFYNGGVNINGTVTNENDFNFQSNGDNTNNYSGFQMSKIGNIGGGATGYRFDLNSAVTGTVYGFSSVLQGSGTQVEAINLSSNQTLSGSYFGLNSSYSGNTATQSYLVNGNTNGTSQAAYGLNFFNSGATDYFNGVVVGNSGNGIHHRALSYNNTGDQTGSGQIIDLQSSGDADSETGLNINLTGSYNNVSGININVGSATSVNQPVGFNSSGGAFNSYSPYSTANYTPAGIFTMNSLGGQLTVASGYPISGGDFGFGANLASVMQFDDDMGADFTGLGLGFVDVGFVGALSVASGKTVDSINMALGGAGVSGSGGTITNFTNFRAAGTLNQGGSITVTNMFGFRDSAALCSMANNCWGIHIEDSLADNFFQKSVTIGGPTGKSAAGVGLEVYGHHKSSQVTGPTATPNANAGTGATCTVSGTDYAGSITLTTGSASWSAGTQCDVTFNTAYGSAPKCTLTATNSNAAAAFLNVYIAKSTSDLTVNFVNPDNQSNTITWDYQCVETN